MFEFGVLIGRFEPFHNAHLACLRAALRDCEKLIVCLGSDSRPRTIRNPWTTAERIDMILHCLTPEEKARVVFAGLKDYLYNDTLWTVEVQRIVSNYAGTSKSIALFGHRKDKQTGAYLKAFPQWTEVDTGYIHDTVERIDATKVRDLYFTQDLIGVKSLVPATTYELLKAFMGSEAFKGLHAEYQHIQQYREAWNGAPFPPTFNTVDAVVVKSGHLLMVRRAGQPGRGLLALPGGFIQADERIQDACIRELKEETSIQMSKEDLAARISAQRVFDHPERSLRGRTITHAFCFDLGRGKLPRVKGADDADKAWWMPFEDFYIREQEFFEDHHSMALYFINSLGQ